MSPGQRSYGSYTILNCNDERLTVPGWAVELTAEEVHFIRSRLEASLGLRIRWGFKRSAKRFSEKHIRRVARYSLDELEG